MVHTARKIYRLDSTLFELVQQTENKRLSEGISKQTLERRLGLKNNCGYWHHYLAKRRTPGILVAVRMAAYSGWDLNLLKGDIELFPAEDKKMGRTKGKKNPESRRGNRTEL